MVKQPPVFQNHSNDPAFVVHHKLSLFMVYIQTATRTRILEHGRTRPESRDAAGREGQKPVQELYCSFHW